MKYFETKCINFYSTAIEYLTSWNASNKDFSEFDCFLLKEIPDRRHITIVVKKLLSECELLEKLVDLDKFFDEFTMMKTFL